MGEIVVALVNLLWVTVHFVNVYHVNIYISTHGNNNLPMPAIAFFIKILDNQSSGRGRGGPTFL